MHKYLLCLLAIQACACVTSSGRVRDNLQAGKDAYDQGDVLRAYRLLRNPALTREHLPPRYSALLKQVTEAAEYLIERWLEKGDFWLAQGNYSKALSYYRDIADQLPDNDPFKRKLMDKAHELGKKIEEIRKQVETLVDEGLMAFQAAKFEQAQQKLAEARWKAVEHNLPFTMRYQRLIEECKRRQPAEPEGIGDVEDEDIFMSAETEEKFKPGVRRRRAMRKSKKPERTDEEEIFRGLLRQGSRYQAKKKYLEAILTYRKVLELFPEQPEAAEALQKIEPIRRRLVDEELRKAGEYFAKEDLEKAAPHYQRVLLLDPGNIRAKEGLQMYRRLKELKDKQK